MRASIKLGLLSLLMLSGLAACSGPGASGSGQGTSTGAGGNDDHDGGGGAGGQSSVTSIALLDAQVPAAENTNAWLSPGEHLDPTTLIIATSQTPLSCAMPRFTLGSASHNLVLIGLPQSMQKPGTYDLSSSDVIAWGSFWLSDGMGNGGGVDKALTTGTVEVVSIDTSSVHIKLSGLDGDFTVNNGDHVALRCP